MDVAEGKVCRALFRTYVKKCIVERKFGNGITVFSSVSVNDGSRSAYFSSCWDLNIDFRKNVKKISVLLDS